MSASNSTSPKAIFAAYGTTGSWYCEKKDSTKPGPDEQHAHAADERHEVGRDVPQPLGEQACACRAR